MLLFNTAEPIKGFENYTIDLVGNILNQRGKYLTTKLDKYGYPHLGLTKDKKRYWRTVHRLVAIQFLPNPENKPQVNHIDGDKTNNHVNNLEWVTDAENKRHAWANGLTPNISKETYARIHAMRRKAVVQMTMEGIVVKVWEGVRIAEREGGFRAQRICDCCKGKRSRHHGFTWRYAERNDHE